MSTRYVINKHTTGKFVEVSIEEAELLKQCVANEYCRLIMEHAPSDLTRQVEVLMYDLIKQIDKAKNSND